MPTSPPSSVFRNIQSYTVFSCPRKTSTCHGGSRQPGAVGNWKRNGKHHSKPWFVCEFLISRAVVMIQFPSQRRGARTMVHAKSERARGMATWEQQTWVMDMGGWQQQQHGTGNTPNRFPMFSCCSKQQRQTYPRCIRLRRRIILEKRGDLGTDATPFFACLSSSSFPFPLSVPFLLKMQVRFKRGPISGCLSVPKGPGLQNANMSPFRGREGFLLSLLAIVCI